MKDYRRRLPPLDSLLFFEAAARHMSFTDAAGELFVTQAAVSKRIQELETRLGVRLFVRRGRRLSLTDSGRELRNSAAMAFDFLDGAVRAVSTGHRRSVRIACNSAVSLFWLQPRLKRFGLGEDACPIELITTDAAEDMFARQNDLVLAYTAGDLEAWICTPLFPEILTPVAAPAYLEAMGIEPGASFLELNPTCGATLLEFPRLGPDWTNWERWAEQQDWRGLPHWRQRHCATYAQTVGAALKGEGIALGSLMLVEAELRAGDLVPLETPRLSRRLRYQLAQPTARPMSDPVLRLKEFLIAEAAVQFGASEP